MDFKVVKPNEEGILTLSGEMDINMAEVLKKNIMNAIEQVEELKIDMENVTDIDLTFLQILCATHKTCSKAKKKISLAGKMSDSVLETFKKSGFLRKSHCGLSDDYCVFIGGNKVWEN